MQRTFAFWEVDAQVDFLLPGGKLYVPGAEKIIPNIKRLVEAARDSHVFLVSSADSHSENDSEFSAFPPHCVSGTRGAQIVPEGLAKKFLVIPNDPALLFPNDFAKYPQILIEKQVLDVFDNPHAEEIVYRLGPEFEYVVFGVVTEYCVRFAARGLLERGVKVAIVTDAIEALKPNDGRRTLDELRSLGARLVTTDEILSEVRSAADLRSS